MRPKKRTWLKHILILLITLVTSTLASIIYPFGPLFLLDGFDPQLSLSFFQILLLLPGEYLAMIGKALTILYTQPEYLEYGLSFSMSLLFILVFHEAGHYIACRIYGVNATLPYFIPAPPLVGPAGTLGAFIKLVSPMPSRRAVFDIGVAGPIAGFIALIPVAIIAVATMENGPLVPLGPGEAQMVFTPPLLMRFFAFMANIDLGMPILPNPFYNAAWSGLLVTALNLIPSGQLDGGHAVHAIFGKKVHYWTGKITFVTMLFFSILGMYFYGSPSGFLFTVILAIMMFIKHPEPIDNTPLDPKRKVVAFCTLLIFILCFVPFPIQLRSGV